MPLRQNVCRPALELDAVAGHVGAIACVRADARVERTRAFVKIQDGCSFSCAFCVIPLVRGGTRSRTAAAVLAEIRRRVDQGHREVVLTGVNLGCFRDRAAGYTLARLVRGRTRSRTAAAVLAEIRRRVDQGHREVVLTGVNLGCFRDRSAGYTLARLVREAGATPGLERLRLSSIEVNHVDDELVRALTETPTVSPHLHVPLQSGDDVVLRAMGRRYTAAQFERRLAPLSDLNLTTDVIVGFPAEDDAAFERTLALVERLGMSKAHVFPYSPRPGTRTALEDAVPPDVKRDRGARLRALSDELSRRRWHARVGTADRVLVDRPGRGYADDYTPWLVREAGDVGSFVRARAIGVGDEGVLAVAA